ncbi:hypothetical protein BVF91_10610 [Thermoanaerobacterium sp. PSU-2]|nr:hypothetical protein BVF91_10610 [Thermoanaerobacterium sp. PSU-2]
MTVYHQVNINLIDGRPQFVSPFVSRLGVSHTCPTCGKELKPLTFEVGKVTVSEHFHPRVPVTDDDGGIYSFPTKLPFPLYGLVTLRGQPVGEVREQHVPGIPVPILQSEAFLPQSIEQVFCGLCYRPIEVEVIPLYHYRQIGLIPVCCLTRPRTLLEAVFAHQRSRFNLRTVDGRLIEVIRNATQEGNTRI